MANTIAGVYEGLEAFFEEQLPDTDVKLAFRDERNENEDGREYPAATISMYDAQVGMPRRYGGITRTVVDHPSEPATMRQLKALPTPVDMLMQLDTYALTQRDDWALAQRIIQILGQHPGHRKVEIDNEDDIHLIPTTFNQMHDLEDNVWRSAYRFRVEVWFEDEAQAEEAHVVLTRHLNGNGETYDMEDPPE